MRYLKIGVFWVALLPFRLACAVYRVRVVLTNLSPGVGSIEMHIDSNDEKTP